MELVCSLVTQYTKIFQTKVMHMNPPHEIHVILCTYISFLL